MKIVLLQAKEQIERVFQPGHLEQLRALGDVAVNDKSGNPDENHVAALIEGADIVITSWGNGTLSGSILDRAPDLKLVLHAAGTVKPIVSPELWARGIRVANATEALGKGVAETALGFTIVSLKDMWRLAEQTRGGGWRPVDRVRELYGVTVGVIGAGKAGSHYIKLLRNFDVRIVLYDPFVTEQQAREAGAEKVTLEQLVEISDVISLHAPSLPETHHMINRERLAAMKDNCILINTARGRLIDEQALVEELKKGRLFACIDVTDPEPPAPDHPFRTLPNVVLTPHIAGAVNNGLYRLAQSVVDDAKAFIEGRPLRGEVWESQMSSMA